MRIPGDRALNAQLRGVEWRRLQTGQRNRRDLRRLRRLAYALRCTSRPNRRDAEPSLACAFVPAGFPATTSSQIFDGSWIVPSHADGVQSTSAPRCNWGEDRRRSRTALERGAEGSPEELEALGQEMRGRSIRGESRGLARSVARDDRPNPTAAVALMVREPVQRAFERTAAPTDASEPGTWLIPGGLERLGWIDRRAARLGRTPRRLHWLLRGQCS